MKKAAAISNRFSSFQQQCFRRRLIAWYDLHRRDLPWRAGRDPYRVWLSEIMLQQTRVGAVIEHYHEFLRRFPTVEKLATAREASVLAAWSGLGYYRRARMLHAAAKMIVREHGGKFPASAERLRALPGIGRYTAAAIASIVFGEPIAVVDGNVERVLQRVSGKHLTIEPLWESANHLLDAKRAGDFNQAIMELGATVCTPRAPACLTCPVLELCATRGELPPMNKPAPQRKREIHYALDFRNKGSYCVEVFLVRRARDASLMPGMWELPELIVEMDTNVRQRSLGRRRAGSLTRSDSGQNEKSTGANCRSDKSSHGERAGPCLTVRHSITLTDYIVRVWPTAAPAREGGRWISLERLDQIALTGLARKILRQAEMFLPGKIPEDHEPIPNPTSSKIRAGRKSYALAAKYIERPNWRATDGGVDRRRKSA